MAGEGGTKRGEAPHRSGSWNVLKSAFHAFSGLMWVAPRTPSLRLGIVVVIVLAIIGVALAAIIQWLERRATPWSHSPNQ